MGNDADIALYIALSPGPIARFIDGCQAGKGTVVPEAAVLRP
jgi:hypothetical protein